MEQDAVKLGRGQGGWEAAAGVETKIRLRTGLN
jgi:hypothetical protein